MSLRVDAVTWWNETERHYCPKAPEVRAFMLDPNNYILPPSSINRSEAARLCQTYLPERYLEKHFPEVLKAFPNFYPKSK